MFDLTSLGTIISDPELRAMLKSVAVRKINSDIKTIQAHAELSKYLFKNGRDKAGDTDPELHRVIREHLDYDGALIDLSTQFHNRLIENLRSAVGPASTAPPQRLTLNLRAGRGSIVKSPFKITNSRAEPVFITCVASPFVSEAGDEMVASPVTFLPPTAEIAPGGEVVFEAILPVIADFQVGKTYFATLTAQGVDAMSIVARLHVEADVTDAPGYASSPPDVAVDPPVKDGPRDKAPDVPVPATKAKPRAKKTSAKASVSA